MQRSLPEWQQLGHESKLHTSVRTDLLDWAVHVLKDSAQTPASHHRLLLRELQALSQGSIDRLLVHMPPGSAKSTYPIFNTKMAIFCNEIT